MTKEVKVEVRPEKRLEERYELSEVLKYYESKTLLYDDSFKRLLERLERHVRKKILYLGYYRFVELHWSNWKVFCSVKQDIYAMLPVDKNFDVSTIKVR